MRESVRRALEAIPKYSVIFDVAYWLTILFVLAVLLFCAMFKIHLE